MTDAKLDLGFDAYDDEYKPVSWNHSGSQSKVITDRVSNEQNPGLDEITKQIRVEDLSQETKSKTVKILGRKALRSLIVSTFDSMIQELKIDLSPSQLQRLRVNGEQSIRDECGRTKALERQVHDLTQANADLAKERDAWCAGIEEHKQALAEFDHRSRQQESELEQNRLAIKTLEEENAALKAQHRPGEVAVLSKSLKETRDLVAELRAREDSLAAQFQGRCDELTASQEKVLALEAKVQKSAEEGDRNAQWAQDLRAELKDAQEKLAESRKRVSYLINRSDDQVAQLEEQGQHNQAASEKLSSLKSDLDETRERADRQQQELEKAKASLEQVTAALHESKQDEEFVRGLEVRAGTTAAENLEMRRQVRTMEERIHSIEKASSELNTANSKLNTDLQHKIEEIEAIKEDNNRLHEHTSSLQDAMASNEDRMRTLQGERNALHNEASQLRDSNEELQHRDLIYRSDTTATVAHLGPQNGFMNWRSETQNRELMVFVDTEGHIWYGQGHGTTWDITNISTQTDAPPVKAGSLSAGAHGDFQHIVFVDIFGKLWELIGDVEWQLTAIQGDDFDAKLQGPTALIFHPDRRLVVCPGEDSGAFVFTHDDGWHLEV